MSFSPYDIIVVGGGCAGLTAAIGLARAGFAVAVVEAAEMPGDNGIGGVCFAENLAHPDILGREGVEALGWERRLIQRGNFVTDGQRLVGSTYRDPAAFRHCYTVLRSRFNRHLAQIAQTYGVALRTETTVESLIRDGRRIIGITTSRGPLYSKLVFLAEGDVGHLVSREGLDRTGDPRDGPTFLYCLQQVIDLPSGVIEERFRLGPGEGIAHDLLLRNYGRTPLNARGLLCTNRQSLTVSVMLPIENLREYFEGDPRQLLAWFADMPALRPWWADGRRGAWTVKLLRADGPRAIPYLVEDGLAIGGAAAGLGVDFPALNLTGPATATGLLLSQAAVRIRAEGGDFDRAQLQRRYLEPLQQTRYWKDMEFAQRWPSYVKKTHVLFDRELDLLLDSAAVWMRPRRWLPRKLLGWFLLLGRVPWSQWSEWRRDLLQLGHALRFRDVMRRPALAGVLLDGALNASRDLVRRPRPHLPPGGSLRVHYHSADEKDSEGTTPRLLRRWFRRFQPVLASAGHILYRNGDMPLSAKLTSMVELLVRQINLLDLLAVAGLSALAVIVRIALATTGYLFRWMRRRRSEPVAGETTSAFAVDPCQGTDEEPVSLASPAQPAPHIHIVWKSTQPRQRADAVHRLPHICPTGVFEVRGEPPENVQVLLHRDRCIQCEACWRSNPFVDWGRGGLIHSSAHRLNDPWESDTQQDVKPAEAKVGAGVSGLLDQLDRKLYEFDDALAREPAVVDQARGDHLEMLARYAQQLAVRVREVLEGNAERLGATVRQSVLELAAALAIQTEERTRRTWEGRFAWAIGDGRQLRQHHLTGLRRLLGLPELAERKVLIDSSQALRTDWVSSLPPLSMEDAASKHFLADIAARRYVLETLEQVWSPADTLGHANLLAAVAAEIRDGLAAQTAEWNALLTRAKEAPEFGRHPLPEAYRQHGPRLLADAKHIPNLLDVPADWPTLTQRRALMAEREEIREAEARLLALALEWRTGSPEQTVEAEVSAGFARQTAHALASKLLLLRTHARLEDGLDAELAMPLLRVWLDYAATLLDEFAIFVRDALRSFARFSDRPLVEPGAGPPPRTQTEYLAAPAPYTTGDFLLAPVDLLQPRLTPEMVTREDEAAGDATAIDLLRIVADIRDYPRWASRQNESLYLAEALVLEIIGRRAHRQTRALDLETAGARLILAYLQESGGALRERCAILQALAGEVVPRWLRGGVDARLRHLGRDVLELEALKADFRQRLLAAWQFFGEALGRNADVQASCFALAEAAAWIKAADSTLGRMAWLTRLCEAEDREEPAERQLLGRRVLAYCHAEVRDRLHRFDEDLAALRRGYFAPHVRAASLLTEAARFPVVKGLSQFGAGPP